MQSPRQNICLHRAMQRHFLFITPKVFWPRLQRFLKPLIYFALYSSACHIMLPHYLRHAAAAPLGALRRKKAPQCHAVFFWARSQFLSCCVQRAMQAAGFTKYIIVVRQAAKVSWRSLLRARAFRRLPCTPRASGQPYALASKSATGFSFLRAFEMRQEI